MTEEKKVKVIFKEGLINSTNPAHSVKENDKKEISEEYYKHLLKAGINVVLDNAK